MREMLNCVEFRASPAAICRRSTIDGTIEENDGIDSASVMPTTSDSTMTIHGRTSPPSRSTTISVGHSIWIDWNSVMTRRRSARSASTPPTSVSAQTGALIANASSPIRKGDAPRVSSNQGCATFCAQVPMFDSRIANQNAPNRGVRRSRRDSRNALVGMGGR